MMFANDLDTKERVTSDIRWSFVHEAIVVPSIKPCCVFRTTALTLHADLDFQTRIWKQYLSLYANKTLRYKLNITCILSWEGIVTTMWLASDIPIGGQQTQNLNIENTYLTDTISGHVYTCPFSQRD